MTQNQGRIQDFSEGGARFISERKHPDLGTTFSKDRYFSCFCTRFFIPLSAFKELF